MSDQDLEGLADALNALDHPANSSLNDLTVGMVELAFNSLPPAKRQDLLGSLGIRMAAPRKAGGALCRDVLTRLRRDARQHTCTCGVRDLTHSVMNQVGRYVFAEDGESVPDPVSRWGATLVRATVFAWCNASVADAHVLAWAADQDWFAATADEEETARFVTVKEAARFVVAANPGFAPGAREEQPDMNEPLPVAPEGARPEDVRAEETTDPEAACRRLEPALAQARQAVTNVNDAIADGRPPQEDDLSRLTALGALFDSVDVVFRAAGIAGVPHRLADMSRAAHEHRAARERDREARDTLRVLRGVTCRSGSAAAPAAEAVRETARRLLDTPVWEQSQRQESTALVALARLVELKRQEDAAAEILALLEQVVETLPSCAMAAFMAHDLTLPTPEDAPGGSAEVGEDDADGATPATTEPAAETVTTETADDTATVEREAVPPSASSEQAVPDDVPLAEQATGHASEATTPRPAPEREALGRSAIPAARTAADEPQREPADCDPKFTDRTPTPMTPRALADDADGTAAEQALAQLVVERRFGLAHHIAATAGHPEPQAAALRLAGAAALLTSGDSQSARLVADLLQKYDGYAGRDMEGSELLLLPALLRTALITGDHLAGAQLKVLVPRLPDRLGEAATAVADRALSGALMIASPLVVIADVSGTEARLRELRDQGRALLAPQRLRFARATEIAKRWLAPEDGMLGALLMTVVDDHRDAVPKAREQAERLSKLGEINNEIDRMDRKYRSSSGKPLQGSGRQDLVHAVERVVALVKEWCLAIDGMRLGDRSDGNRAVKEISSLRQSLLDGREAVLDELEQLARCSGAVAAATAWAARASMEELYALLAGDTTIARPGGSLSPELVLDAELLKVCDTRAERPPLNRLLTAVDRSWSDALAERLAHDAFTAARDIVELAERGALPAVHTGKFTAPTPAEIAERETTRRAQLRADHDGLVAELHRAQADGAVADDQDLRLQELLADAQDRLDGADAHDLMDVRRALDTVRRELPAFRQQAADRVRARLDALDLTAKDRAQALRHLDAGRLATAADLVYFLEIGEDVPEIEPGESHLTEFFPAVPDGLPQGINRELVEIVRSGGKHPVVPVLDYGTLSSDEATLVADVLDTWRELGATEPKDRHNIPVRRQLPPILKLLGYDGHVRVDERSPHRREYRWVEATEVLVNGRAKAPAFGSQIREQGSTLRVLMVWGRPSAKIVMSWAQRDTSGASLLVVYFGTLNREARNELAVGSDRLQPLLVVDDAALAYLAARGNRQVSTATQTLLPFSGVNPYIREKRGRIGGEMFYGRDAERRSILDPHGTQVIFGGRGLGKSALLSDAGEEFERQRPGYHQAVYINLDQENIGKGSSLGPEDLWSVLNRELSAVRVLGGPQGRKSSQDMSDRVRAGIRTWLDADSRRRLLVLLDECDQFFEADAPRFNQTKKLKGLGSDTKDRAKVVFAGLHSVQRFSKLASNGPFGHLAQTPKVIGPLAPQYAAELLVEPMGALGFEFQDMDLVNRVLGYCSYQPFLLQMFGHRLVELMHRKRGRRGVEGPPYRVEVATSRSWNRTPG
nr:hypothetical protein [Streptomyces sp. HF10]